MKFYHIKPEYLTLWGEDTTEETVISSDEVAILGASWGKQEADLLEQLEEVSFKTAYAHLMDKCCDGKYILFYRLTRDEMRYIVDECPSWDWLDNRDSTGKLLYDLAPVTVNGTETTIEAAAALMDDEIREALHAEGWIDPQEFTDRYCEEHRRKYGEEFTV